MAYNITETRIKELVGFAFSRAALEAGFGDQLDLSEGTIRLGGETEIGLTQVVGDWLFVDPDRFHFSGDFSGNLWDDVVVPAMQKSIGFLDIILVFEGGDSVYRYKFANGQMNLITVL
jgi:hypothetical protein